MSAPSGREGERRRHHHRHRHDHDKYQHKQQCGALQQQQQQHNRRRGGGNGDLVPLAALISREMKTEKMERPKIRSGCAAQSKKGEDYFLMKEDCQRLPGSTSSTFSAFAVSFLLFSALFSPLSVRPFCVFVRTSWYERCSAWVPAFVYVLTSITYALRKELHLAPIYPGRMSVSLAST